MSSKATENIGHELSSAKNIASFVTLLKIKKKKKEKHGSSFRLPKKDIREGKSPNSNVIINAV